MAREIERKFLVVSPSYRDLATEALNIRQGYLSANPEATVRVRISGDKAWLTVKSLTRGCSRGEWEYPIPVSDANELFGLCARTLEKTRYLVPYKGHLWEVDEFHGRLKNLVVAEIELPSENAQFEIPSFIGKEVTADPYFFNSNLSNIEQH